MLKLVGTDGKRFYSWVLKPGKYITGRRPECDFSVPDRTVSRDHAEIEVTSDENQIFLTDLGSHNGTLVDGERITGRVQIKLGNQIMFGHTQFKLAEADDSSSAPVTPMKAMLADDVPKNSIFLSINEALQPLPAKVTERPELLPTLFDMAKMLVLPEPREVMLERSLGMIAKVIPAERLAVLFVSDNREEVYTAASLLPGGKDPGAFTLSRTIVNEIMTNKNAILICDAKEDPRFAEQKSIILSELKSAVAVPLFDEGKVLGILYADTTNPLHRYDNDHLRVLATFGNIIASRLLNYALLSERQEKQITDAELSKASLIQKSLLVADLPEVSGYTLCAFQKQSRSVGGDLYDVARLPDGRVLVMVADVSGKGMGAALLMANILASFRILYEARRFELLRAVERVSLQLCRYNSRGDFATLFVGLLEPGGNRFRYINAGHNPPVLVRENGTIEYLDSSGLMIGAFDFATWTEGVVELSPGDVLVIFSDGVTEAERDSDQYGDERMEKLVVGARGKAPQEIVDDLMENISGFVGDASQSDDLTLLVIKRVVR